ncbi:hypothetical protein [Wenyingzhuangia sp. IMCC45467]
MSFLINDIINEWSFIKHSNVYLTPAYLIALENSKIPCLSFIYVVIYKQNIPVGVMYFQCLEINRGFHYHDTFQKEINKKLTNKILKNISGNLLMCGNFFATGVNGFVFNKDCCDVYKLVKSVTSTVKSINPPIDISFLMFKEFRKDKNLDIQQQLLKKFIEFEIDVSMVLIIKPTWNTFDEYLSSLTTKYRTRAKSVLKKTDSVKVKQFTADEIKSYKSIINTLYLSVVNTARFNMVKLTDNAFYYLKKELQEKFVFTGYFIENKMVAFSTACFTDDCLDANYVGIDYNINKSVPLYKRVLYDYVTLAIKTQVKELRLGRTAEIMKSGLGAEPVGMSLYLKHTNKVLNTLLTPLVKNVKPNDYELRKPFKNSVIT